MQVTAAVIILLFLCYPCLVFDFLCATQMLFITFTTRMKAIFKQAYKTLTAIIVAYGMQF